MPMGTMNNATNCRWCIDCERMVSPEGHCFRCYGEIDGAPLKRDFAVNKTMPPLAAPIWCPNRIKNG